MRGIILAGVMAVSTGAALAQPIIIPLQHQNDEPKPQVSSPPVAPPMAGPSVAPDSSVAGASTAGAPETASQPPPAEAAPRN